MTVSLRIFLPFVAILSLGGPACADQTDARLDLLFDELRSGSALDADANIERIRAIWSQSQSETVNLLYERAEGSAAIGDIDLALSLLDHVVGLTPNFAQGYAFRGVLRLQSDDRSGAIDDFGRVIELEPRHFDIRNQLAGILFAANEKEEAYEMYQKTLEWNPHDERARERARQLRLDLDGQEI